MQSQNSFLDDLVDESDQQLDTFLNEVSQASESNLLPKKEQLSLDQVNDSLIKQNEQASFLEQELIEPPSIQWSQKHTLKQNDETIKKEDLEAIDQHKMDANWLFWRIKEGIENAVVQWPKWEILPDRKARANLINAFMKATGRFKSDNIINVLNLFGKVNTDNNNDIY